MKAGDGRLLTEIGPGSEAINGAVINIVDEEREEQQIPPPSGVHITIKSSPGSRVVRRSEITKKAVFGMAETNKGAKRQSAEPVAWKVVEERPCCAELLIMDNVDFQS